MKFTRAFFDPEKQAPAAPKQVEPSLGGDRRDGGLYVYEDRIVLAVNAALAADRPLLIEGPPGSGKSSLAPHVARVLGWWFYERVITSRTSAQDLLYEFDAIRRLNDAQVEKQLQPRGAYVEPSVLWWAFDPESASRRGASTPHGALLTNPGVPGSQGEAVVLLDEIDKAEPDVPNDLLVPIGSREFHVKEADLRVSAQRRFLLVITSNGERDLAPAFLRRCIRLTLEQHGEDKLVEIAGAHFGGKDRKLHEKVARLLVNELQPFARQRGLREPGTAEFLDAVRVCRELKISPDSSEWEELAEMVLTKVGLERGGSR